MATRRRKNKTSPLDNAANIVKAIALVVIAVLLVVFVGLYIKNSFSLSEVLPGEGETAADQSDAQSTSESTEGEDISYGLVTLEDGSIIYSMTKKEAARYDDEFVLEDALGRYLLVDSWLDLNYGLYHFGGDGVAVADGDYSERAFTYHFNGEGRLSSISYDKNYSEQSVSGYESYPGVYQTKSLWAYMDSEHTIGNYVSLMYKKTTSSSGAVLGAESARQYASPYAFEIIGSNIYYLAVDGASGTPESVLTENIEGKVFSMTAGADTRYIWAEDAIGFKALKTPDGDTVVYSYDGSGIHRSDSSDKDSTMVVFTEDLSYKVSIEDERAYLELSSGQRVTMEASSFKAGNFTYSLASDGEILSVAAKTTVNTGGYTYYIQHGTSFGAPRSRVIRQGSDGTNEVISSEFDGTTANLHYDYDSSSMIAEYEDSSGRGGLLKIGLSGDVDIIGESLSDSGSVTLYAIQDSVAVIKGSDGSFYTARISADSPIAVAVDPVAATEGSDDDTEISDTPVPAPTETSDTSVGSGPGTGSAVSGGVIYTEPTKADVGPGGS